MNINALVISYNSPIADSPTLQSLLKVDSKNIKLTIHIWNNGPNLFEEHDVIKYIRECNEKEIDIYIYQDTRNISLAKIYNYIISKKNFDFIAILDQDSTINSDYMENIIKNHNYDLIFPRIITGKGDVLTQSHPHSSKDKNILINEGPVSSSMSSITSGLVLSKKLISKMEKYRGYVFEEKLGFYGIDVDFFIIINRMIEEKIPINAYCIGSINHSLSFDDEIEVKKPFRYIEMLYFKIFFRKNHQKKNILTTLWICLREILRGKMNIYNATSLLLFIFTNTHPRSKFNIKKHVTQNQKIK
ncbi:hypothetical protein ABRP83_00235 [Pectobacterium brasiliense]|uniref:glycosyltransferase family 2 protein n=1 Tax=Pectobacterium brasiliense TaxID=180957 RepID=UPI0032EB0D6A